MTNRRIPPRRASKSRISLNSYPIFQCVGNFFIGIIAVIYSLLHLIVLILLVATFLVCMYLGINTLCKSSEYYAEMNQNAIVNSINAQNDTQVGVSKTDIIPSTQEDDSATTVDAINAPSELQAEMRETSSTSSQENNSKMKLKYEDLEIVLDNRLFTSIVFFAVGLLVIFLFIKYNDFVIK